MGTALCYLVAMSLLSSVYTTGTTAGNYPGDKVPLPLVATGRMVHTYATHGSPRVCGGWG